MNLIQIMKGLFPRKLGVTMLFQFFGALDRVGYWFFSIVLQAVFDIANFQMIDESVYANFQQRVYVILGVFMVFKVTISLLTYLVNPDKINDKEQGLGKLVSRTIVVIIMLAGLPFFFRLLDRAQPFLLEAVPRILIGKNTDRKATGEEMGGVGDTIAWTTFKLSLNEETINLMESEGINTVAGAVAVITEPSPLDNSEYKYWYLPVVGIIFSVVMSFLMVGFCIDVAIRAFKLIILRMIAPIPIISYLDPKSSKDGAFSNWTKQLMSTWLDLFIKIGILYFILYMIDIILLQVNFNIPGYGFLRSSVVVVFIIIGLLFFAKQVPNFVSTALGIKNSKGLGLGLGGMIAGAAGLLGGAGLVGAVKASADYMNEANEATAQGKASGPAWTKGKDIAAQLKTGDKNAKGGIMQRWSREQDERAKVNAGERRAQKLGLSATNVDKLKGNMFNKDDELKAAQDAFARYQTLVQSGQADYDAETAGQLQQNVRAKSQIYLDAQKAYETAKKAREELVPQNEAFDSFKPKRATYRARTNLPEGKAYEPEITTVKGFETKLASNRVDPNKGPKYEEYEVAEPQPRQPERPPSPKEENKPGYTTDDYYDSDNPGD